MNNCKHGSAWHTWQKAGASWQRRHPYADVNQLKRAAISFGAEAGYPQAGRSARERAFLEGARDAFTSPAFMG